jgi:hypothetical protein
MCITPGQRQADLLIKNKNRYTILHDRHTVSDSWETCGISILCVGGIEPVSKGSVVTYYYVRCNVTQHNHVYENSIFLVPDVTSYIYYTRISSFTTISSQNPNLPYSINSATTDHFQISCTCILIGSGQT